jgi:hypothetical protein
MFRRYYFLKLLVIATLCLWVLEFPQAGAQLGIGIGIGRGGFWGPGYYGPGFYRPGFGSFFGIGVGLSPGRSNRRTDGRVSRVGWLEGRVNLCPPEQKQMNCSAPDEVLGNLVISAIPAGGNQWFSTRPDRRGEYRLQLPSGRYRVRADIASNVLGNRPLTAERFADEIRVEAGRSRRLDLDLHGAPF